MVLKCIKKILRNEIKNNKSSRFIQIITSIQSKNIILRFWFLLFT
jgi:hypothetical protein